MAWIAQEGSEFVFQGPPAHFISTAALFCDWSRQSSRIISLKNRGELQNLCHRLNELVKA